MNREIKFRAWHKVKNIMVYDNEDDTYGYWDGCRNSNVGMVNEILNSKYYEEYEFMQFTGLHDKNGKAIWEKDIVQGLFADQEELEIKGRVIYSDGQASYIVIASNNDEWELGYLDNLEVIGNIYEDSELLGGE